MKKPAVFLIGAGPGDPSLMTARGIRSLAAADVVLYDHLVNGATFPSWTDSGMDIVSINNVDAMAEAWATNDFTNPLPPP